MTKVFHLERKSPEEEKAWRDRSCLIYSHPRCGSHWLRRMLAEIVLIRSKEIDSVSFGKSLNRVAGFQPATINSPQYAKHDCPVFYANHQPHTYKTPIRVFLRRNFEDVFKSCQKAEKESDKLWFTGTREEVYERWKKATEYGCTRADLVIDYKMMQADPAAAVRAVYALMNFPITDEEVARAVRAGSRENMLKEQEACDKRQWDIVNIEEGTQ